MFLVQTTLWMVQISVLAYYSRSIYLSMKYSYSRNDAFDITDIIEYIIRFAVYSAGIQFLIYLLTQLSLHMN